MVEDTDSNIIELSTSERILNLEYHLDRSLIKWEDAIDNALKAEKDLDAGLVSRCFAGEMVIKYARACDIIHWEEVPVPEKKDKHQEKIIQNNREAIEFNKRLKEFEKEVEKIDKPQTFKDANLIDFKVGEILMMIRKRSTKKGTLLI